MLFKQQSKSAKHWATFGSHCTNENNSWEPEDNCKNVHNTIAAFYHKYPQAPRQIVWMQFNNLKFQPYQNFTQPPNPFYLTSLYPKPAGSHQHVYF